MREESGAQAKEMGECNVHLCVCVKAQNLL